jgi:hypothetical protein
VAASSSQGIVEGTMDNRRPSALGMLAGLNPIPTHDPYNIFDRWSLARSDPDAKEYAAELSNTWATWSDDQRSALLWAVDLVAREQQAKRDWQDSAKVQALAETGIACDAVRLGAKICATYPAPFSQREVAEMAVRLAEFVRHSARTLVQVQPNFARYLAARALQRMRLQTPKHVNPVSWEMVGKLAWLAAGKVTSDPPNESTIRRLAEVSEVKPVGAIADQWNAVWDDLQFFLTTVDRHLHEVFAQRTPDADKPYETH